MRRVDPQHRSLGEFFQQEIATPLGIDFYIRLPEAIPNSRLAVLAKPKWTSIFFGNGSPTRLMLSSFNPHSNIYRAVAVNPGPEIVRDTQHIYARNLEVPSAGGVGTARAIARVYSVFATGGEELKLLPETLRALSAPEVPPRLGFYDECLLAHDVRYSLGFTKPSRFWQFGSEGSFGAFGAGGAIGFADPKSGIGYAYVTSQMGTAIQGDPRDLALRKAIASVCGLDEFWDR